MLDQNKFKLDIIVACISFKLFNALGHWLYFILVQVDTNHATLDIFFAFLR